VEICPNPARCGIFSPAHTSFTLEHEIFLTGLTPGTRYYYWIYSRDPSGNETIRGFRTFRTAFLPATPGPTPGPNPTITPRPTLTPRPSNPPTFTPHPTITPAPTRTPFPSPTFPDTTGPFIMRDFPDNITQNSVDIYWSTNEPADGQIELCAQPVRCGAFSQAHTSFTLEHKLTINGLNPGTRYYYWIHSRDRDGNETIRGFRTFRTAFSTDPTPGVTPTATFTPRPTPVPTLSRTPTPTPIPTPTPTFTPTPSRTPTPSPTVSITPTPTITPTPSRTPTPTPIPGGVGMVSINFDDGRSTAYDAGIPILLQAGFKNTNYIHTKDVKRGAPAFITPEQIRSLRDNGMEIGAHSINHVSLISLSEQQIRAEVIGSINDLNDLGITNIKTFAYPFGDQNATVVNVLRTSGLIGARATGSRLNTSNSDVFNLTSHTLTANMTLVQIKSLIDQAKRENKWLILVFHLIDNSGNQYAVTPAMFQGIIDHLKVTGIPVVTMTEGISRMSGLSP
jgi:peptidoglycan/xylan/chitin deacetylase (PgdA/CDA1 family)